MFKPVNRYIYIEVPKTKPIETLSGIVLPDDYKPKEERHSVVSVVDWSKDLKFKLCEGDKIVVERSEIIVPKRKTCVNLSRWAKIFPMLVFLIPKFKAGMQSQKYLEEKMEVKVHFI